MPIYEYLCNDCGTEFEKRVARAEDAGSVICPSCGKSHLTQRFSSFATMTQGLSRSEAPSCAAGSCCPSAGTCGLN
ncbi:MAG: FmdB family zinc ribbon protein [Bryobacteraceae bacterium]